MSASVREDTVERLDDGVDAGHEANFVHRLPNPDDLPNAMNYPALELLTKGYLTLDWPDDYPNAWAAVDDYVANEPIAGQLPNEVAEVVAMIDSEEGLRTLIIGEFGSGYLPDSDGLTMTSWLLAIGERVRGLVGE